MYNFKKSFKWFSFYFSTAEFHGTWESLIYDGGLKTQVEESGL